MIMRMADPRFGDIAVPGIAPKLSETPSEIAWLGPDEIGGHNKAIYRDELKLSDADLEQLEADGVI